MYNLFKIARLVWVNTEIYIYLHFSLSRCSIFLLNVLSSVIYRAVVISNYVKTRFLKVALVYIASKLFLLCIFFSSFVLTMSTFFHLFLSICHFSCTTPGPCLSVIFSEIYNTCSNDRLKCLSSTY